MSMVSYASGARYLSLIGGTLLSFYDWYCDLPPSSPQTWGEQTDVPESADWYNSGYIIAWGSNVPQTRTPDAHFFVESRYNGTKVVAITPDYSEVAKLSDLWLHPKQGTDAAFAMAMGHVIYANSSSIGRCPIFKTIPAVTPTCRCWCGCGKMANAGCPTAMCAKAICPVHRSRTAPHGRPLRRQKIPATLSCRRIDRLSLAGRGRAERTLESRVKDGETGEDVRLALSLIDRRDDVVSVAFPYFGGKLHERFPENDQGGDVLLRNVPARRVDSPTARCTSPRSSICSAQITDWTEVLAVHARHLSTTTFPIPPLGRNK